MPVNTTKAAVERAALERRMRWRITRGKTLTAENNTLNARVADLTKQVGDLTRLVESLTTPKEPMPAALPSGQQQRLAQPALRLVSDPD